MVGYVAVGIYLMESTFPTENWYPVAEQRTYNEIVQGLNWLAIEAFQRNSKLVWVYPPVEKVSTGYEPITMDHVPRYELGNWVFHWLDDIYTSHGLTDEWDGAFALANELRQQYKTNWAIEFSVVMDDNDADHRFADSLFAYASNDCLPPAYPCDSEDRSPIIVMTYNNASYGSLSMDRVVSHEVSHAFGASDEYYDPALPPRQCNDEDDCDIQQSYLATANGNCEFCNPNSMSCYMRRESGNVCTFTPPELGWRDSDGDGVSDAIDQNYSRFCWILYCSSGDILRIYNSLGRLINVFCVTEDQLSETYGAFYWNGVQLNNSASVAGRYSVTKNGAPHGQYSLSQWYPDPDYPFSNHYFLRDTLRFTTPSQDFFIRHDIFDSSGALMGRFQFDVMTRPNTAVLGDLTGWPDGMYTSRVFGWLPSGTNTGVSVLTFVNYACGDVNNDGLLNTNDITYLIEYLFKGGPGPIHSSSADVDNCSGVINVADLTYLVNYLFEGGAPPVCCHNAP